MTPGQSRALETCWEEFGLELSMGTLLLDDVFYRNAPTVMEIGFGMGESLLKQARENAELNFIGIEVHKPGVGHLLSLVRDEGISNIRVFNDDSLDVMATSIAPHSLDKVQLFFPDPWPKKRHHKRRIVNPAFLDLVAHCLKPGGMLHIATDWSQYAEAIEELLEKRPDFSAVSAPARPETKFEARGTKLGHEIHDLAFQSAS